MKTLPSGVEETGTFSLTSVEWKMINRTGLRIDVIVLRKCAAVRQSLFSETLQCEVSRHGGRSRGPSKLSLGESCN